jgi:hypothetical protein
MPRHLDPETRKVCESSGDRPTDAEAHVRHEARQEEARQAAIARWQAEQAAAVRSGAAPTPIRHGTETHAEIASIRAEVLAIAADPGDGFGHASVNTGDRLVAVAQRLAALLPPAGEDAATEIDDAIDLGHSN